MGGSGGCSARPSRISLPQSIVWADSKREPALAGPVTGPAVSDAEIDSPWLEVAAMVGASERICAVLAEPRRSSR